MAQIKAKELKKMAKEELDKKLDELKFELVKSKVNASKTGSSKTKEVKRAIAKILTIKKNSPENKISGKVS